MNLFKCLHLSIIFSESKRSQHRSKFNFSFIYIAFIFKIYKKSTICIYLIQHLNYFPLLHHTFMLLIYIYTLSFYRYCLLAMPPKGPCGKKLPGAGGDKLPQNCKVMKA